MKHEMITKSIFQVGFYIKLFVKMLKYFQNIFQRKIILKNTQSMKMLFFKHEIYNFNYYSIDMC